MKKFSIIVLVAALMASCGYKTKTITLETEADSVNYALGLYYSNMINDSSEEVLNEYLDAIKAGYNGEFDLAPTEMMGLDLGVNCQSFVTEGLMKQPQLTFNGELFLQAIVNTWLGDTTTMTIMQAMQVLQSEPQEGVEYEAVPAEKCPSEQAEVELKNHLDSVNYASALYYISQYKPMLEQMDTITPKEQMFDLFVENVNKGLKLKVQDQNAYFGGRQIGNMLRETEEKDEGLGGFEDIKLNFDILFQGVINGLNDYEEMMSKEEAMQFLQELSLNRQFGEWKKQNEQWLTDNQKKDSIQTTASGLQYKVIREGNGEHPAATDTVVVDYEGSLINDTVFDSSYKRGEPLKFALNGVIAGWTEGLQLMSPGAKYMLYIPQELAYGERNQGIIQPFSTLIFTVELKKVIKATPQAAPAQENSDIQIQKIN